MKSKPRFHVDPTVAVAVGAWVLTFAALTIFGVGNWVQRLSMANVAVIIVFGVATARIRRQISRDLDRLYRGPKGESAEEWARRVSASPRREEEGT